MAAQTGEADAQEELLRRFRPLLLSVIRPVGQLDAAELLQEAAYQFLWLLADFQPESGVYFERYIREKLRWRLANVRRSMRRHECASIDVLVEASSSGPEDGDRAVIREALQRLPERQQALLVRLFWLEQTPQQIAESLGVTPRAVRKARATALQKLGAVLADSYWTGNSGNAARQSTVQALRIA